MMRETPKLIAFLRAINVGGHTVKMDALRRLFEELGCSNVETFIASGNVIFESSDKNMKALEEKIEGHLRESLGYEVKTFIRSALELAEIANYQAFPAEELAGENTVVYIAFLPSTPDEQAREKLLSFRTPIDDFHVHKREIYWLCRKRMSESTFSGALLERAIKMPATLRNSTTVKKLAAKYGDLSQP